MFKKNLKIGAQNQLSGKDRKVMKGKLTSIFHIQSVNHLFETNEKILSLKVSGSKMIVYSGDQYPLLVDSTGKSDYFPSIYVCNSYEPLLKILILNQGVESYIFNGANLMWPGVKDYSNLGKFKRDEVIAIQSAKGQLIAIGATGISYNEINQDNEKTGIAAYILHFKGDKLWDMGPKYYLQPIIKLQVMLQKGQQQIKKQYQIKKQEEEENIHKKTEQQKIEKQQNIIKKQKTKLVISSEEEDEEQQNENNSQDDSIDMLSLLHTKKNATNIPKIEIKKKHNFNEENSKKKKGKKGKKKQQNNYDQEEQEQILSKKQKNKKKKQNQQIKLSQDQQQQEKKQKINPKLMDEYFKQALLNTIKITKIQAQLPIDSGQFYSDYLCFAGPKNIKLQIKDSTYKKLSKFYQEMSKQKIIEFKYKKEKKGQQGSTITNIFWQCQDIKNHIPTIKELSLRENEQKNIIQDYTKHKLTLSKNIKVEHVYRLHEQIKQILYPKNYMPQHSQDEQDNKKINDYIYLSEIQLKEKIETYLLKIRDGKCQSKKLQKITQIDYTEHTLIRKLLLKEIEQHEQDLAYQYNEDDQQEETDQKKHKKHQKKGILKIDTNLLMNKLLKKNMAEYHLYDKTNLIGKFKGEFKGIQLIAQKTNNKNITRIIGLETFITPPDKCDLQLHWLSNVLQKKFASSVNIQNLPGKNMGKEIILHGTFIDDMEEMFIRQYEIKKQYITIQNKLDRKKKNN